MAALRCRYDAGMPTWNELQLRRVTAGVAELRDRALALEREFAPEIDRVDPNLRDSARNLVHYLSVRRSDIRELQEELSTLGLSSLGRMEAHTHATLEAVLSTLRRLAGAQPESARSADDEPAVGFKTGPLILDDHCTRLLGPPPVERKVRIMVTMPTEAASEPRIVRELLAAGMNVMRINCAHDDAGVWLAMIAHLRTAKRELGRTCAVLADLPGPKLRTGSIEPGPGVIRIRPRRDARGRVLRPAVLALASVNAGRAIVPGTIGVQGAPVGQLEVGDVLRTMDARGRERSFTITAVSDADARAESDRTTYLENGATLLFERAGTQLFAGSVCGIPGAPGVVVVDEGDRLWVTREDVPGRAAERDDAGTVVRAASVPCTLAEVFAAVRTGEPVHFDDGKLEGRIDAVEGDRFRVRITRARPGGAKLRSAKGINLPGTDLDLPALSARDLEALDGLARHVDMFGMSFVRSTADIEQLQDRLFRIGAHRVGIVLKVENAIAFRRLPRLLLTAMRSPLVGVMLARGDLAVEVGYERLSEVQEELLWICEAAHVPVIWATQVLEDLAKKGVPSRSEVTDAAMSGRAECVMLNKGPHIVRAVELLSRILDRMEEHQSKKSAIMRRLSVSEDM
jgi:pyruvate kinase